MRELSGIADKLRLVQQAKRRFIELWAVEDSYVNPMLDRMADELLETLAPDGAAEDPADSSRDETL